MDHWYTEFLPKIFIRPTFPREFVIPNFETIAYRNVKRKTEETLSWMYDKYDNDNYHVYKDINHYHNGLNINDKHFQEALLQKWNWKEMISCYASACTDMVKARRKRTNCVLVQCVK